MPRRRREPIGRRPDLAQLNDARRAELCDGHTYALDRSQGFLGNQEAFRRLWLNCREWLLPEYIELNPGTRPFAWWVIDHGKERPVVSTDPEAPYWLEVSRSKNLFKFAHGQFYRGRDFSPLLEEEPACLRRLGLLTPAEKELDAKGLLPGSAVIERLPELDESA